MNFFERLWDIQLAKWDLFLDYWFVWVIIVVGFIVWVAWEER